MKARVSIIIIALLLGNISIFSQDSPFQELLKDNNIQSTYITKFMLEMAPDMKIGNTSIRQLEDVLDQVEVYSNIKESNTIRWRGDVMMSRAEASIVSHKYNLLMKLNEGNLTIMAYGKKRDPKSETLSELVMITFEDVQKYSGGICRIIRLVGNFTLDDVKDIAAPKK